MDVSLRYLFKFPNMICSNKCNFLQINPQIHIFKSTCLKSRFFLRILDSEIPISYRLCMDLFNWTLLLRCGMSNAMCHQGILFSETSCRLQQKCVLFCWNFLWASGIVVRLHPLFENNIFFMIKHLFPLQKQQTSEK